MDATSIIIFISIVLFLLVLDLRAHRGGGAIPLKSAILWTGFYVVVALGFAGYLYLSRDRDSAVLFLTGWGLEKVLAFDNLIVFASIFAYFGIKAEHQHKILHWGILGAIVLRLVFVSIGVGAAQLIGPKVEILFAALILYSAYIMIQAEVEEEVDYANAWYVRYTRKWLPVTEETTGGVLFLRGKATPLFIALVAIEISDIMFAFDSVPVIIAVTKEPFLIYTSMIFAILGLRSMYFVLSALTRYLHYLEQAVILILVFIAGKLLAHAIWGVKLDPLNSLAIVGGILFVGITISLIMPKREQNA